MAEIWDVSVCKWLFELGEEELINKANDHGDLPMQFAAFGGDLPIMVWLFKSVIKCGSA